MRTCFLFRAPVRIALFCLFLSCCAAGASAQDRIYKLDGTVVEAKVLEIGEEDMIYKSWDNQEGPDYRIALRNVARVVFENGTRQDFAPQAFAGDWYPGFGARPGFDIRFGDPLDYHGGHYYDRYGRIYDDRLREMLGVSMYGSRYLKARRLYESGVYVTMFSGTMFLPSLIGYMAGEDFGALGAMVAMGAAGLCVGIPLWVSGNRKLDAIADDYNSRVSASGKSGDVSLRIGPNPHGFGLALEF